jgi:putative hydrolase of the HAD superfamily
MSELRAVFFDVGGTLLHLDRDFILACLAQQGVERDYDAFANADRAGRAAMIQRLQSPEPGSDTDRWRLYSQILLDTLGCTADAAAAVRRQLHERNADGRLWAHMEPDTAGTLQQLRARGLSIGVVSNSDGRVAQFLEHAGLSPFLDFVVDSGVVGVEKPDPRIFEIACERGNVRPDEVIHVGDLYEIDVVGARNAGITPVLIDPWGARENPDCDTVRALPELVQVVQRRLAA